MCAKGLHRVCEPAILGVAAHPLSPYLVSDSLHSPGSMSDSCSAIHRSLVRGVTFHTITRPFNAVSGSVSQEHRRIDYSGSCPFECSAHIDLFDLHMIDENPPSFDFNVLA